MNPHDALITEQFTRQADAFARHHASDEELMDLIMRSAHVKSSSQVLDIACGPGIVTCALAKVAGHVTGLDMVQAMLERAERTRSERGLENISWKLGSATGLPFEDESFDIVVTRFSFHHYLHPEAAMQEMVRVCRPGGTVLICDVSPDPEKQAAYDEIEKLRDPSHTSALLEENFLTMGVGTGLNLVRKEIFPLEADLEKLMAASFPPEGNADLIRARLSTDIQQGNNLHGMKPFFHEERIRFYFPILILVWQKTRPLPQK